MNLTMVQYRVKPESVSLNENLVRAVYAELEAQGPPGFRYGTFQSDGGDRFVHLAMVAGAEAPLPGLESFRNFQDGIADRCTEAPAVTKLREVGSYRFMADD